MSALKAVQATLEWFTIDAGFKNRAKWRNHCHCSLEHAHRVSLVRNLRDVDMS